VEASQTAADPFAGTAAATDDPFAETAPPADPIPADTPSEVTGDGSGEALPVVDREGAPVGPPDTATAAGRARAAEAGAQPPVETPAAESTEPEPQPPVEAPATATEGQGGDEPPQDPPAPAATADEGGSEPEPEPTSGAKQVRLYKLLYQTGETTWEESPIPDEYAEVVPDEKHGPQRFLKARNNDHARRLAFSIHGRPDVGVTIVPVPASSWKPRRVKAAPPRPERERLVVE
jgi:hypothetical protein